MVMQVPCYKCLAVTRGYRGSTCNKPKNCKTLRLTLDIEKLLLSLQFGLPNTSAELLNFYHEYGDGQTERTELTIITLKLTQRLASACVMVRIPMNEGNSSG